MSAALPALMFRETFRYRKARGCTRSDAACVANSMRLAAQLSSVAASALEELLFSLCSERKGLVVVEVHG